jgi:hypothetical protein
MSFEVNEIRVRRRVGEAPSMDRTQERQFHEIHKLDGLTIGSAIHFVMANGPSAGQCRHAVVVRNWSGGKGLGLVNAVVSIDGANDAPSPAGNVAMQMWVTSIRYSEQHEPCTWHWPKEEQLPHFNPYESECQL